MLSSVKTGSLCGLKASPVTAEADISPGLPNLTIVGLPDAMVRESRERIRAAIANSGFDFPQSRVTINLAPASMRKEGSHFDLPIALSILNFCGVLNRKIEDDEAFIGELSLDGSIGHVEGALPLAIGLRGYGVKKLYLPESNRREAAVIKDMELVPLESLAELVSILRGERRPKEIDVSEESMGAFGGAAGGLSAAPASGEPDYSDIYGQEDMKRVMSICAAGYHGLVMMGAPGAGKTMLARRLPTILPALTYEEMLECTQIYSIAGRLSAERPLVRERPFRAPHHSVTEAALMGGGMRPRPGEISLAHNGVLFLDELPEFSNRLIEMLRQPIEEGSINVARQGGNFSFPCRCILVAASNPCKCGYYGDRRHRCTCPQAAVDRYMNKLSGPLLERLDLQIEVRAVDYKELMQADGGSVPEKNKSSAELKAEVEKAIEIQRRRYKNEDILFNSQLSNPQLKKYCRLNKDGRDFLEEIFDSLALSARTYNKVLKVARTIADLEGEENISPLHLAEAVSYRQLDRKRAKI